MTGRSTIASRHGRATGRVRNAVQAAVRAADTTRPQAGAPARDQALWWHRTAGALQLLAEHEADPARAESALADAATARRLAAGMGSAHAAEVAPTELARKAETERQRAAGADSHAHESVAELADVAESEVLEASL